MSPAVQRRAFAVRRHNAVKTNTMGRSEVFCDGTVLEG